MTAPLATYVILHYLGYTVLCINQYNQPCSQFHILMILSYLSYILEVIVNIFMPLGALECCPWQPQAHYLYSENIWRHWRGSWVCLKRKLVFVNVKICVYHTFQLTNLTHLLIVTTGWPNKIYQCKIRITLEIIVILLFFFYIQWLDINSGSFKRIFHNTT